MSGNVRMRLSLLLILFVGLSVAASSTAMPAASQRWVAKNWVAKQITGDINVSDSRIVFQNGRSMELRLVSPSVEGDWGPQGESATARIFTLRDPSDAEGFNRLHGPPDPEWGTPCGDVTPGFVGLFSPKEELWLLFFAEGPRSPAELSEGDLCATYVYTKSE